MTRQELESKYIIRDGKTFTPQYIYDKIECIDEETEEIEETYIDYNYTITKTAEEVYQEWLEQKDIKPQKQLTQAELQQQLLDTQAYLVTQAENKYKEVTNV